MDFQQITKQSNGLRDGKTHPISSRYQTLKKWSGTFQSKEKTHQIKSIVEVQESYMAEIMTVVPKDPSIVSLTNRLQMESIFFYSFLENICKYI